MTVEVFLKENSGFIYFIQVTLLDKKCKNLFEDLLIVIQGSIHERNTDYITAGSYMFEIYLCSLVVQNFKKNYCTKIMTF
jgi:hypothetical protein